MFNNKKWITPSRGEFTFSEMIESIKKYINADSNYDYEVIIGVDSQAHPNPKSAKRFGIIGPATRFVVTVIVRRVGKGAQYYYIKEHVPMMKSLRDKIWKEAILLFETIEMVRNELEGTLDRKKIIPNMDVGENGKTGEFIKEVTGLFIGSGYDVKIKPESYGASTVADKHSK